MSDPKTRHKPDACLGLGREAENCQHYIYKGNGADYLLLLEESPDSTN